MKRFASFVLASSLAVPAWAEGEPPPPPPVDSSGAQPPEEAAPAPDQGQIPPAPPPVEEHQATGSPPGVEAQGAPQGTPPTLQDFQKSLAPYGRWVDTPEYGLVWIPSGVGADWRPYSNGQWVYTNQGWAFAASEPWGWAPFHYGRWIYYPRWGWGWIPGYEWAPAWVSWRYGAGFVAWAPLGPLGIGIGYYAYPSLWIAVSAPLFVRPLYPRYFIPTARIGVVFRSTYFAGVPRRGYYTSPPAHYVARITGHPVVARSIGRATAPGGQVGRGRESGAWSGGHEGGGGDRGGGRGGENRGGGGRGGGQGGGHDRGGGGHGHGGH